MSENINQVVGEFLAPPEVPDADYTLEEGKRGEENPEQGAIADGVNGDPDGTTEMDVNQLTAATPVATDEGTDSEGGVRAFSAGSSTSFEIVWKGSPNFWEGRTGTKPLAIVNHIMQSSLESATSWFNNPNAEASSHFGVGKDGRIYQYVRLENSAWANGPVNRPDGSIDWLANAVQNKINPNRLTISIEHEGKTGEEFPETQYQATLYLHKMLINQFQIAVDRHHIIGHYQIDSVTRPQCPGRAFPWDRLMGDLAAVAQPQPVQPTAAQPADTGGSVPGFTPYAFGPGTVNTNNAFVRVVPSFGADGKVLRKLTSGTTLKFDGYTDQGPAFRNTTRWYRINQDSGGGWIHALMIS